MGALSPQQGEILVRLARQTIADLLGLEIKEPLLPEMLNAPVFKAKRGVFVTLKKKGQLRGCIGTLTASEPLIDGIRHQAENAAFADSRFSRLEAAELAEIEIEISILSEPSPLAFSGPEDLVAKLRPHIDGVILSYGRHQATFLPQVWDQLPNPEDFLSHLAMKAGLLRESWRNDDIAIAIYQVQHFGELDD